MDAQEYIKSRLDDQINWYSGKSISNQRLYKQFRISEFILAALIPFLSGFVTKHWAIPVIIGLMGAAIAIITAVLGLYQFEKNWIDYRATCESLRKEKFLFLTGSEPYSDSDATNLVSLVQRVEALISKENTNWAYYMVKPKDETSHAD